MYWENLTIKVQNIVMQFKNKKKYVTHRCFYHAFFIALNFLPFCNVQK